MSDPLRFVNHRLEDYAMQVTFEPSEGTGTVVYNLSLIHQQDLDYALSMFKATYEAGVSPSGLIRVLWEGETNDGYTIPEGHCGLLTLCSTTLDGLLIKRGIPFNPIGGGVVEISENIPRRFTHLIKYEYTTIDPLQVLVSQEITSVQNVMRNGTGSLLGNIRECHMEAEDQVEEILEELNESYFTGILDLGLPNTACLGVAVDPQYMGVAALGGTNWIAALREEGIFVRMQAMKGVTDIARMEFITEIDLSTSRFKS
jgi:repressor of nif and glnA expression